MHACMHTYTHTYIHAYIHTYMHACMHTYMHACMHACIHTYIHYFELLVFPVKLLLISYVSSIILTSITRYSSRIAAGPGSAADPPRPRAPPLGARLARVRNVTCVLMCVLCMYMHACLHVCIYTQICRCMCKCTHV